MVSASPSESGGRREMALTDDLVSSLVLLSNTRYRFSICRAGSVEQAGGLAFFIGRLSSFRWR